MVFTVVALLSCDDSSYMPPQKQQVVVEGWIEDGEFPVVMLTRSMPISTEETKIEDLSIYLLRWAKVSISDGENEVILTGKFDNRYYPPYIYTTGHMRGEAGKTYTLHVEDVGVDATATTTIPKPIAIDKWKVEKSPENDTLYTVKACFRDNPNEKNYYQMFSMTGHENRQFLASNYGSIDDAVLNEYVEIPIYRGNQLGIKEYLPYFGINEFVHVKVACIDKQSFDFWNSYTKMLNLSGNMFLSTDHNIISNIHGGMGYWCGYGSTTKMFRIADLFYE